MISTHVPTTNELQKRTTRVKCLTSQKYTFDEIKKHNNASSCWLAIRNKVYDVTEFLARHPGGNFIFLGAGRDSTYLFKSYHPLYVRSMIDKFYIGEVGKM